MGSLTLKAIGLEKSFGNAHIIKGIDLTCSQGEITGLLGPNGAGKTTTFYMIVGLIKADKGTVYIGDKELTEMDLAKRANNGIGYLPQEASVFRGLRVDENIRVPLEAKGLKGDGLKKELDALINGFGLQNVREHKALSLSGGERRKLEIARALALDPLYLLLDEPFAGIDPITVKDLQSMILDLKKRGIGVIITDHNVKETLKICDRAYIIHHGVVIEQGDPLSVIKNEQVQKIYVGNDFSLN